MPWSVAPPFVETVRIQQSEKPGGFPSSDRAGLLYPRSAQRYILLESSYSRDERVPSRDRRGGDSWKGLWCSDS